MSDASLKSRPHDGREIGPPPKRLKVSQPQPQPQIDSQLSSISGEGIQHSHTSNSNRVETSSLQESTKMEDVITETANDFERDQRKEKEVGILYFVNGENQGFSGILKQRYTDFQVNEIMPDGTVCHLTDDKAPKRPQKKATELNPTTPAFVPSTIPKQEEEAAPVVSELEGLSALPAGTKTTITIEDAPEANAEGESASTNEENKFPAFAIVPEDASRLAEYVTEPFKDEIIAFHQKVFSKPDSKASVFGSIFSPVVDDKGTRGMIHALVRRMFECRIETMSDENNRIKFFAAPKATTRGQNPRSDRHQQKQTGQLNGKLGWDELGGPHLHFSLYKENKDTMEVVTFLSKMLRIKNSDFSFAGTKDRRAATVQRVSVFKQQADKVAALNRQLRNARIGNFSYGKQRLELGELSGNLFTITLRDCRFNANGSLDEAGEVKLAGEVVGNAVTGLQKNGFINYFGLQRFGTFEIGTDCIGMLILQGKFKEAVEALLTYSEDTLAKANDVKLNDKIGRDDLDRAQAIHLFKTTGRAHDALDLLPRRFSAESAVIRHMGGRNTSTDYLGAIQMISRNLKTMYVHAYQSKVWNIVVSERWARYGTRVIKGDLVLIDRAAEKAALQDEVDENGEVVIHPEGDEIAVNHDDLYERARPLTAEEASSGKYTIFDIVLPTPGYDMEYPNNSIGDFYKEFMESEQGGGLDPGNMRRNQKDFSLSGSYRKFMAKIGEDFSYEIVTYKDEAEQLVETDWDKLQKSRPQKDNISGHDNLQNEAYKNRGVQNGRGRGVRGNWANGSGLNQSSWGSGGNGPNSRGGRGRGNGRGGSPNNAYNHNEAAARNREQYKDSPQMNAWKSLPGKLASEDKARGEAADLAGATREKVISAPVIHETWIQTAVDNATVLTGQISTTVISEGRGLAAAKEKEAPEVKVAVEDTPTESKPDLVEEMKAPIIVAPEAMDIDKKEVVPIVAVVDKSDVISIASTEDSIGGVAFSRKPSAGATDAEAPALPAISGDMGTTEVAKEVAPTAIEEAKEPDQRTRIAVIVKFSLKSSQYATVALRELMQGVKTYKPDYNSGR